MTEVGEGIREWAIQRVRGKFDLPHETAEDVVQKTLIKMSCKDVPEEHQKSWLITALPRFVYREYKNYVATRVNDISMQALEIDEGFCLEDILPYHESGYGIMELKLFLEQVGEGELLLQYAEHEAELADILGIRPGTLRMRVKLARDRAFPLFSLN